MLLSFLYLLLFTITTSPINSQSSSDESQCARLKFVKEPLVLDIAPADIPLIVKEIDPQYRVWTRPGLEDEYNDGCALYVLRHWTAIVGINMTTGKILFARAFNLVKNPDPGKLWAPRITVCRHLNGTTLVCAREGSWLGIAAIFFYNFMTGHVSHLLVRNSRLAVLHHDFQVNPQNQSFLALSQSRVRVTYGIQSCKIVDLTTLTQLDSQGNMLWGMDLHPILWPLFVNNILKKKQYRCSKAPCECRNSGQLGDFFHANTVLWDVEEDAIYMTFRHIGSIAKVNRRNSSVEWLVGHIVGHTAFDAQGEPLPYGFLSIHEATKLGHNRFLLFDNNRDIWGFYHTPKQQKRLNRVTQSCLRVISVEPNKSVVRQEWSWCFSSICKAMGYAQPVPQGRYLGHHTYEKRTVIADQSGNVVWNASLVNNSSAMSYRGQVFFFRPPVLAELHDCEVNLTVYDCFYRTHRVQGFVILRLSNDTALWNRSFTTALYWQPVSIRVPIPPLALAALPFFVDTWLEGIPHPTVLRFY